MNKNDLKILEISIKQQLIMLMSNYIFGGKNADISICIDDASKKINEILQKRKTNN